MPMDRKKYPANWEKLAKIVKDEADWTCEECGRRCYRPGEKCPDSRNILTVAHLNHKPWDCRRENLKALCSGCHLKYDAKHHADTRRKNRIKNMSETFKHHEFDDEQIEKSDEIRDAAEDLEAVIAMRCVPSREKALAATKLEECIMWANKAIALHGVWDDREGGERS